MSVNITPRGNADSCIAYYQRQDVELEGVPQLRRSWGGKGIERLGVHKDSLNQRSFNRLCHNKHPLTNRQLTARMRQDRVVLTDVTLAGPKSVSVAAVLSKNGDKVIDAHHAAGDRLMEEAAKHCLVRRRKDGLYADRQSDDVIWSRDTHLLSRKVQGRKPDMQLHSHYCLFNAAYDRVEGQWKALKTHRLMRPWPKETGPPEGAKTLGGRSNLQKLHMQYLREELHARGIQTRDTKAGWELKNVPDSVIKKFSARRGYILDWAEKVGAKGNGKRMRLAGLFGRQAKEEPQDYASLKEHWLSQLTDKEQKAVSDVWVNPKTIAIRKQVQRNKSRLAGMRKGANMQPGKDRDLTYER